MMKRKLYWSFILATFVITGCANNDNAMNDREDIVNEMDPSTELQAPRDQELNDRLGYVRYTKDQLENSDEINHTAKMDRTEMANMITKMILRSDNFNEVATLVTDKEVLIAYELKPEAQKEYASDIAKKTAMSVMPRYFEIYVSDNENLIQDIHSLHNSNSSERNDFDNTIDTIIKEMKKSPQGLKQNNMEEK
ncbi:YhcN/YlaJ family sporulation lipoprotein [Virgibacillus halodenitrificans]|uniref:YhcN/YlaJ family sporulation lipoprotein n=1 Tax=Virgibacillus halodenitrificans TaxID=1482 RepID=UPI002DBDAB30|nr:YhcN/YlaJ family sporulation lipoprotein [Virgibacillus halodenitrificans]MEC2159015.1 YhcN/YlaJ family sporulation lipoprotein [Virgibacillus halodenitrificans]